MMVMDVKMDVNMANLKNLRRWKVAPVRANTSVKGKNTLKVVVGPETSQPCLVRMTECPSALSVPWLKQGLPYFQGG